MERKIKSNVNVSYGQHEHEWGQKQKLRTLWQNGKRENQTNIEHTLSQDVTWIPTTK